jgi:hypothetical protein
MKKLVFVIVAVLGSMGMASAQSDFWNCRKSAVSQVSTTVYSTPKTVNYNTTYKSGFDSYQSNQTYKTGTRSTTVNTTRTYMGGNNYMSGTDVFSNGSKRSSSRTTSIDFGGSRMTTTNYFDCNGNIKSRRTKTTYKNW